MGKTNSKTRICPARMALLICFVIMVLDAFRITFLAGIESAVWADYDFSFLLWDLILILALPSILAFCLFIHDFQMDESRVFSCFIIAMSLAFDALCSLFIAFDSGVELSFYASHRYFNLSSLWFDIIILALGLTVTVYCVKESLRVFRLPRSHSVPFGGE